MYWTCITVTQSTIITSPIRLNIGLTNVNARLKQRCINVVPMLCNVVSKLCNVVSTLFQRRALTLYQLCVTLKIRRRLLFHFQRRINVIWTLIHNVETMLVRRRNVCWETLYQTFNRFELVQASFLIRLCTLSVSSVQSRTITLEQRFVESWFDVIVLTLRRRNAESVWLSYSNKLE